MIGIPPSLLVRLDRLSFVTRRVRAGHYPGERCSTRRGFASTEFADYRDYARGDDLRRVDWNIYARLERAYVKLFEEEEDLAVHILLDGSGSMDWGGGDAGTRRRGDAETRGGEKWEYARRLTAALGYIALTSGDRLTVTQLPSHQVTKSPNFRGRAHALRLFEWLGGLRAGGTTDLNASLRAYAAAGGRAGLVLLISDLFSPSGCLDGITALLARGHQAAVIHLLSPAEVDPPLRGDLRLVDVETGAAEEVTVDSRAVRRYRQRLAAWQDEIRAACHARNVRYLPLVSDTPLERAVLHHLRQAGIVK